MKPIFSKLAAAALFVTLALCALPAFAQQGRWRLIRAEYGAENSWSDVTPIVRSLIRNHALDIRADNTTFGGDPAPGLRKTLRLRIENERGETKVLTFPEKAVVQLSLSTRWDYDRDARDENREYDYGADRHDDGDDGGGNVARPRGLRILRADYGADGRFADVTARLASQIQDDRLMLPVNNSTMGGDPADDHRKTLTVWYIFDGRAAVETVSEHASLALPADADFIRDRLRIMRAQYGADFRYFDVTSRLNSLIQNDQLILPVNNDTMGGDPAPDRRKRLTVVYLFDGQPCHAIVDEKASLELPNCSAPIAAEYASLEILHATYGAEGRSVDVTARLSSLVSANHLQFVVSNDSLGGDPAHGLHKQLRVIYRWNGVRYEVAAPEGDTLVIP